MIILTAILLTILICAVFAGVIAFPIGAVLYWVITCWIGLLPTLTFWSWYGIAFVISFIVCIFTTKTTTNSK